jgi:hypothetical protein
MENMEYIDSIREEIDEITYEAMMPYENKTIIQTSKKYNIYLILFNIK